MIVVFLNVKLLTQQSCNSNKKTVTAMRKTSLTYKLRLKFKSYNFSFATVRKPFRKINAPRKMLLNAITMQKY